MKLPCEIKLTKNLYTVSDLHVLFALTDFFKVPIHDFNILCRFRILKNLTACNFFNKQFVSLCAQKILCKVPSDAHVRKNFIIVASDLHACLPEDL